MRGAEWPQEPGREWDSAAHQRVGTDGVGVAAPIVPIVAFINICANLRAVREKCSPGASPCGWLCPFLPPGSCPLHTALSCSPEIPRGPGPVPWHCTHLLAGLGIVHPHARDGVASIATGTGLAAEPGRCVDALGAREAGVGMGTLQHQERHRLHPRAQHPSSQGGCCPRLSWGQGDPPLPERKHPLHAQPWQCRGG